MPNKLFLSVTVSMLFAATTAIAEDLNQPQDHRSTINQQQNNQVGQPIDSRIDSEIKQNRSATPIIPPTTQPLPVTPPSRTIMTPEPPSPPTRVNPQTPQTTDRDASDSLSPSTTSPSYPGTTYPEPTYPDPTRP
ncbi:hypothetical protein [Methylophaga nitratireducenticrescens]|uniref:hypothetical protein n=1 Tax=Methylophaga nitratireducenticrescens TaxID=754476 RepID=UPI00059CEEB1|nr:hypothetical protein [Methylophaga nitratireducenticrescens]ASF49167.1 hypothetical protein Q7A_03840 [Methylophaga nitratireducenticrescens]AUZ85494.1 hypothetical protein CDW43_13370 [Methylophaga nitratireducenticrescens]